jgi:hypothetical protein
VSAHLPGSAAGGSHGRNIRLTELLTGRKYVDHEDGDPLNCTRDNMRPYDEPWQNAANRRHRGGSASRYKGVQPHRNGRFRARITAHGRQRHIGFFDTEEAAARAYDVEAAKEFGPWARLNFPVSPAAVS